MLLFHLDGVALDLVLDSIWQRCGPVQMLSLAAAPSLAVYLAWDAHREKGKFQSTIMGLCLLGSSSVYFVTPMLVEDQPGTLNQLIWGYTTVRYGLSFLSCCTIVLFMWLARLHGGLNLQGRRLLFGLVLLLTVYQVVHCLLRMQIFRPLDFVPLAFFAVVALTVGVWIVRLKHTKRYVAATGFCMLLLCIAALSIGGLSQRWHAGYCEHFDRYRSTSVYSQLSAQPHRILVLDERSYPYFGSRRQNYVQQPMLFYGSQDVVSRMDAAQLDLVAARQDNQNAISRYQRATEELSKSSVLEEYAPHTSPIRLFRRTEDSLQKR